MTEAQKHLRNQLLTKIHTNAEYKNIVKFGGKEAWEEWLMVRFGVDSAKWLSISELNTALGFLRGVSVWNGEILKADKMGRNLVNPVMITQKQLTQILALQADLGWRDGILMHFVLKQTKKAYIGTKGLVNLTKKEASSVITGMTKIAVGYVKKKDRKSL